MTSGPHPTCSLGQVRTYNILYTCSVLCSFTVLVYYIYMYMYVYLLVECASIMYIDNVFSIPQWLTLAVITMR